MFKVWLLALCIQVSPDGKLAQFEALEQFSTKVECEQKLLTYANNPAVNALACIGMAPKITTI